MQLKALTCRPNCCVCALHSYMTLQSAALPCGIGFKVLRCQPRYYLRYDSSTRDTLQTLVKANGNFISLQFNDNIKHTTRTATATINCNNDWGSYHIPANANHLLPLMAMVSWRVEDPFTQDPINDKACNTAHPAASQYDA